MAIATRAALLAASRRELTYFAPSATWQSSTGTMLGGGFTFWGLATKPGGTGIAPGTAGAQPTSATAGSMPMVNPAGGNALYLADMRIHVDVTDARRGWFVLYDRLCHNGGFDGTVTTLQTFSTPLTIGRGDTTGANCIAWIEVYTTIGATAQTLTVIYTNQAGTGSRTGTISWAPTSTAARMIAIMRFQDGDTGVRSVESCQWGGSTGTAGSYGITLARVLTVIPYAPGVGEFNADAYDAVSLGMPAIDADACLGLFWQRAGTTGNGASLFNAVLGFVEG